MGEDVLLNRLRSILDDPRADWTTIQRLMIERLDAERDACARLAEAHGADYAARAIEFRKGKL